MTALDRVRRIEAGEETFPLMNGGESLSFAAIAELGRRQDFLLDLLQTIGLAQAGWETMDIWEQSRK